MSGQIDDTIKFNNFELSIIKTSERLNLDFPKYGIIPEEISSDCHRGFWCICNITDDDLFLEDLYIHSKDNYYPEIEGIAPLSENEYSFGDYRLYKGLHLKLNYTGMILAGDGFLREYYIHTWFQWPWAYTKLTELVFSDGHLIETIDQSRIATDIRKRIDTDSALAQKANLGLLSFLSGFNPSDLNPDVWWL